ncbi:hypothetical protein Pla123a_25240 [Posidoniimonas polymericola]|uniref:Uncharacterized protein n=1 Tax=Posidoniimonas polymericola TaxID=2528002 RepID=A0A5C5YQ87_9BACT|nr:hypothetical protein [Posidoniimonas polymericola]TWT77094.1 hypothetical protein Pla123a_25240 [Posidoniimonas polymericola]
MLAKLFLVSFAFLVGYALLMYAFWAHDQAMPAFWQSLWFWGLYIAVLVAPLRWTGYDDSWMTDFGGHDGFDLGDD